MGKIKGVSKILGQPGVKERTTQALRGKALSLHNVRAEGLQEGSMRITPDSAITVAWRILGRLRFMII
jgi:hypothetical protein